MYDVVIIGAGIAGTTAAIYAKRAGIDNLLLIEKGAAGGQIRSIDKIDNYPGAKVGITGMEFADGLTRQLNDLEIEPVLMDVKKVTKEQEGFIVQTDRRELRTKTVICASGAAPRRLGVKGETEFAGRGVSYCAVCDGFFFRNKEVAVIGGGNTALEDALYLSNIASKVYVVHRRDKFRGFDSIARQVMQRDNIIIKWNSVVEEISGKMTVGQITLNSTVGSDTEIFSVNGVFIAVGYEPYTDFIAELVNRDSAGFVEVDHSMSTASGGLYACGDCIQKELKQLVTCASEGAVAAMSAYKFLESPRCQIA